MKNRYSLVNIQKKYKKGGFALISEKTGKEFAFGTDIKKLYEMIDKKKIKDSDKIVTYVPPLNASLIF